MEIGVAEARDRFGELLNRAEHGEEVIIKREDTEIARLVPATPKRDRTASREALSRMRERAKELKLGPFNWEEWKQYRDEGRR